MSITRRYLCSVSLIFEVNFGLKYLYAFAYIFQKKSIYLNETLI